LIRARLEAELMEAFGSGVRVRRYRDCLRVRRNQVAFHPNGGECSGLRSPRLRALANVAGRQRTCALSAQRLQGGGNRFRGSGRVFLGRYLDGLVERKATSDQRCGDAIPDVAPYEVTWLKAHHGRGATTAAVLRRV
jgi:hypothetical protein